MDPPSPFKSRPHSAATTPRSPARSLMTEEIEMKKIASESQNVETSSPREEGAVFELSEIREGSSTDIMKASKTQGKNSNEESMKNDSSEKKNLSEFEERESCCTFKVRNSFVLCCGFLCFGASMAILGPTILEMGCLIGSDVGSMSWVFFSQSCSALIGAICSGFIIDR